MSDEGVSGDGRGSWPGGGYFMELCGNALIAMGLMLNRTRATAVNC